MKHTCRYTCDLPNPAESIFTEVDLPKGTRILACELDMEGGAFHLFTMEDDQGTEVEQVRLLLAPARYSIPDNCEYILTATSPVDNGVFVIHLFREVR